MGGDKSWEAAYSDPLRLKPDGGGAELTTHAVPQVEEVRNENCSVKLVMMHRPTHNPKADKNGEYPFSWHLEKRTRLWELRLQIQFQRPPARTVFFGVELDRFVPVSGVVKQAQKALVSTCQRVVGESYHTVGDNPASTQGELEAPAFVMPLWAFDQFHVAEVGQEPSLTGDLTGVGMTRAGEGGVSKYVAALKSTIEAFCTNKVYTFCFWGVSKFLDIIKWEVVGGIMPGIKLDFNRLCGSPPVYITLYELLDDEGKDKRHLASRKRQYFRCAAWSALRPPAPGAAPPEPQDDLDLASLMGAGVGEAGQPDLGLEDLLGLSDEAAASALPPKPLAPAQGESTDLLGLF